MNKPSIWPMAYLLDVRDKISDMVNESQDARGERTIKFLAIKDILRLAKQNGQRVYLVGNGGSAATASHFANDLTKMAKINAISIPDLTSVVTAYGNDEGWENMFDEPIYAFFNPGDVLVAISYSGRSRNVIKAARGALDLQGKLIVITGKREDNPLGSLAPDTTFFIETDDIRIQEDIALIICHGLAGFLCDG